MNKQEYNTRMGYEASESEFNNANAVYMNANGLDKDQFCEDWKQHSSSIIIADLSDRIQNMRKTIFDQIHKIAEFEAIIKETAENILSLAGTTVNEGTSTALISQATALVGMIEVLRIKLVNGYNLTESDRKYLSDILLKSKD